MAGTRGAASGRTARNQSRGAHSYVRRARFFAVATVQSADK